MLLTPNRYWWLVPGSILAAFLWQFWPLSLAVRHAAPDFLVLVTLYWVLQRPQRINSNGAFALGLLRDSIEGAPLGTNALALVLIIYLTQLFNERLSTMPLWQQTLLIGPLYTVYLLIGNWTWMLFYHLSTPTLFFASIVTTTLCWPVCYFLLYLLENGYSHKPIRS